MEIPLTPSGYSQRTNCVGQPAERTAGDDGLAELILLSATERQG